MNVLDLFSGIGGFSLGLERAGMRPVAFCEIDEYSNGVLRKWWPKVPIWRTGIVGLNALLRKALTSSPQGSPARTFHSLAKVPGLPAPVRDSSGIFFEPFAWFDHDTRCWRTWQRCLVEGWTKYAGTWPRSGYDTEWHCIPASAVGAPHQRDRIWIVATDTGGEQYESNSAPLSGKIAAELSRAFADATTVHGPSIVGDEPDGDAARVAELAYAGSVDVQRFVASGSDQEERSRPGERPPGSRGDGNGWWAVEPDVGRVADGVPYRVDRLRGLGNAVVPQIPEIIGRAIMSTLPQADKP